MYKIGIIGGLGPIATVYFLELLLKYTEVEKEQEYIPFILENIPNTPDRTEYILNKRGENPLKYLINAGVNLEKCGAKYIVIPCVTAHYFYNELQRNINVKIISIIDEVIKILKERNIDSIGILATNGTIQAKFLQNKLSENNIKCFFPKQEEQEIIMNFIYNLKNGKDIDINIFNKICENLYKQSVKKILLSCTELSLIKKYYDLNYDVIDVLEILAKASILYSKEDIGVIYE